MSIECVNIEKNHLFSGNPISEQHKLRFQSIIKRQDWDVPSIRDMEYDEYDTPAAYYLIKRDEDGKALGVSRLCATDRPYMLAEHFPQTMTKTDIPKTPKTWETTRFCVNSNLPAPERKKIVQELVVAHLEFALDNSIENIIAITYPIMWKSIFINSGWSVDWLGDVIRSDENAKIIAGSLRVSKEVLRHVMKTTGINHPVLDYGERKLKKLESDNEGKIYDAINSRKL